MHTRALVLDVHGERETETETEAEKEAETGTAELKHAPRQHNSSTICLVE